MAVVSDPFERFVGGGPFDQFQSDLTWPSPTALSTLNAGMASAKTLAERDELENAWRRYMSAAAG